MITVSEDRSVISMIDITERKKVEEQIKASLHEKEILLREVHHRVKNNMQVISSLLRMQAEKIKDEGYADMLRESQERIRSMSLLHEKLYQSKDFANVDFKGYVETLVNSLFRSYGVNVNKVKINIRIEDIQLDLENAIPCGLIINELISNSLKYAFPEGREGAVAIDFRSIAGDELELVVADNGVGIPEDVDIKGSETLGLYLVTMLGERQLDGEVEFSREGGTKCRIRFKRQEYKPRI
jgi:two-component sensor histidine kinase